MSSNTKQGQKAHSKPSDPEKLLGLVTAAAPAKPAPKPKSASNTAPKPASRKGTGSNLPVVIRFDNVVKTYKLYKNDRDRFRALFSDKIPCETIYANNHVSFSIEKGETVAFLGSNGAGKSTTLSMITGVAYPTSGEIDVRGRVSAMLNLQAGFDGKLTGEENIQMRAQLWGLDKDETAELMPRVAEFAEIGSFMQQPLRTYSSGMKARLGFAFASSIDPDILLVDETLSVGDYRFSQKCKDRVKEITSQDGVTVVLVTHASAAAYEFCDRGIVLEKGKVGFDGPIEDAIRYYDPKHAAGIIESSKSVK